AFQMPVDTLGRLSAPEQFDNIIVKATQGTGGMSGVSPSAAPTALPGVNGERRGVSPPVLPSTSIVRLADVARVEMGAQNYNQSSTFDGHPAVGVSVYQLP